MTHEHMEGERASTRVVEKEGGRRGEEEEGAESQEGCGGSEREEKLGERTTRSREKEGPRHRQECAHTQTHKTIR